MFKSLLYNSNDIDEWVEAAVREAYMRHSHAFTKGCSRTTLWYWVRYNTKVGELSLRARIEFSPQDVRRYLIKCVDEGLFTKGVSHCGYTTFVRR